MFIFVLTSLVFNTLLEALSEPPQSDREPAATMSAADMFWAAPPIARYTTPPSSSVQKLASNANNRTITAAAVLISIPGHLIGVPSLLSMIFIPPYIFTLRMFPQVWRLVTSFLITGPQLGMILDPYFLFTYCSNLETTASRFSQPGDFFVYLMFCAVIILVCRATATRDVRVFRLSPAMTWPSASGSKSNAPPVASVTKPSSLSHFLICLSTNLVYLPVQPSLAVTVPGNEGDYPCTVQRAHHSQSIQEALWGAGSVGFHF